MSPHKPPVRLVVADDSLFVREAVAAITRGAQGFELAAVCDDLESLMAAVENAAPDVVVTDVGMAPTFTDEGIRAAEHLRYAHPEVGVVVLSQHTDPAYVLELFRTGSEARAYLLKAHLHDRQDLLDAIRTVADGGSMVDPKVVESLTQSRSRAADSALRRLTVREVEVLREVAEGKSNTAIARELGISKRAVEKHIRSIFGKLDLVESDEVSRRVKAVLIFLAAEPLGITVHEPHAPSGDGSVPRLKA
jgi:DNA-binding NarL/FixJ family response regulator